MCLLLLKGTLKRVELLKIGKQCFLLCLVVSVFFNSLLPYGNNALRKADLASGMIRSLERAVIVVKIVISSLIYLSTR